MSSEQANYTWNLECDSYSHSKYTKYLYCYKTFRIWKPSSYNNRDFNQIIIISESQRAYFNAKARLNSYLREQYHSLQNLLWKNDFINMYTEMPKL